MVYEACKDFILSFVLKIAIGSGLWVLDLGVILLAIRHQATTQLDVVHRVTLGSVCLRNFDLMLFVHGSFAEEYSLTNGRMLSVRSLVETATALLTLYQAVWQNNTYWL